MRKHIFVSAGVIRDLESRVLIAQRANDGDMGGLWEFPGGKIEDGECPQSALKRELFEELNIDAVCEDVIYEETYAYSDKTVTLYFIEVSSFSGEIKPLVHEKILWVDISDIDNYEFPPADDDFLKILKEG